MKKEYEDQVDESVNDEFKSNAKNKHQRKQNETRKVKRSNRNLKEERDMSQ